MLDARRLAGAGQRPASASRMARNSIWWARPAEGPGARGEETMPTRRIVRLGLIAWTAIAALTGPAAAQAPVVLTGVALTGVVSAPDEPAMEGVLVSAKRAG